MLTNGSLIAETAERLLENISADHDGDELIEVADLIVVAVVHYGTADEGRADVSSSFYASNTGLLHRQLGLLEEGRRAVLANVRRRDDEDT